MRMWRSITVAGRPDGGKQRMYVADANDIGDTGAFLGPAVPAFQS